MAAGKHARPLESGGSFRLSDNVDIKEAEQKTEVREDRRKDRRE